MHDFIWRDTVNNNFWVGMWRFTTQDDIVRPDGDNVKSIKTNLILLPECNNIQIMPGLEGDLEEWQTQEVNVTRGQAEGDIDLEGLPFLKVTRGPRHYLFCYS